MTAVAERRAVPPPSSASTPRVRLPSRVLYLQRAQLARLRLVVVSRGSWMVEARAHIWPTIIRRMCGRATEQKHPQRISQSSTGHVQDGVGVPTAFIQDGDGILGRQAQELHLAKLGLLSHLVHHRQPALGSGSYH